MGQVLQDQLARYYRYGLCQEFLALSGQESLVDV